LTETALIIEVPESEFLIGGLRSAFDESASLGVPAHITVLYPFMLESEISESVLGKLRSLAANTRQYSFQLVQWGRFDTALWLRPSPEEPFRALTHEVWRLFPSYPPYGGKHVSVQPHLTVAQFVETVDEAGCVDSRTYVKSRWNAIEASTISNLPINCVATGLSLYAGSATGNYKKTMSLPFLGESHTHR